MSSAARADLVVRQSTIDAKGQTESSVKAFQPGFTAPNLRGNVTLVPAAAPNTPDRLFVVSAFGGHIWVSKDNDATEEPRGVLHYSQSMPITLKAGEALKVAPVDWTAVV
jgi:hypothetical protein